MALGKTIQIYCPNGEPRGVRIAEVTTRIVQAVVIPRAKLDEARKRPELASVGVYYLFGGADESGQPIVYIGEAEDCAVRLSDHNYGKDFWNLAVAIVSRTGSFTKAHVRLLEWLSIRRATEARRYKLDNANSGIQPTVPEWMAADVEEIFETAEVLLSAVGHPVFEPLREVDQGGAPTGMLYCRRKGDGVEARGMYTEDGLVVLEGSHARGTPVPSMREYMEPKRAKLIAEGVLKQDGEHLLFTRDYVFNSPSGASDMICGASTNGWEEWVNERGESLDALSRKGAEP